MWYITEIFTVSSHAFHISSLLFVKEKKEGKKKGREGEKDRGREKWREEGNKKNISGDVDYTQKLRLLLLGSQQMGIVQVIYIFQSMWYVLL